MTSRGITGAAMLIVLLLGGCGGGVAPTAAAPSATVIPTPSTSSAEPSPTPTYATENEVASVIAGGERTWREAAEASGKCRIKYVLNEKDLTSSLERLTCYTNEVTATTQAQIAIRDLGGLSIPPSMQSLVDETLSALQILVNADLEHACGPVMKEPNNTKACDLAMGSQTWGYTTVTGVLDKWAPYL